MNKWEYCAVGPLGPDLSPIRMKQNDIKILFVTPDGINKRSLKVKENNLSNYVGKIIAYLGLNGWELAGCGTGIAASDIGTAIFGVRPGGMESHMLYFKRPIEE